MSDTITAEEQEFEEAFAEFATGETAKDELVPEKDDEPNEEAPEEEETPSEEEPEADDSQESEEEPEAEPEQEDEPQELDEVAKYKQEVEQWKHRYNSDVGRLNAYQAKIRELEAKQTTPPQSNPNPQDSGMTDKEWQTLSEDYPDIAQGIEKRFNALSQRYENQIQQLSQQIQPLQEKQQQQYFEMQMQQLNTAHPDWRDVSQSPDYQAWLNQQPQEIQAFMGSQEAEKNIYLLDAFKSTQRQHAPAPNTELQQKRSKQLQQAKTVPSRQSTTTRSQPSEDDYEASFEYFANKVS